MEARTYRWGEAWLAGYWLLTSLMLMFGPHFSGASVQLALLQLLAVKPEAFKPRERKPLVAIALLGFIYSMWALYGTGEQAIFWGFLVLMAGIPLYTWRQWRNRVQGEGRALQARALGE